MTRKRKFRALTGAKTFRKWAKWAIEDTLVAEYVRQDTDQYKKPSWVMKVISVSFEDAEAEEKFAPGKQIGLNSNGMLDKVMEEMDLGEVVQIVYKGMDPMGKGPNEGDLAHCVEVSVAEGYEDEDDDSGEDLDGL